MSEHLASPAPRSGEHEPVIGIVALKSTYPKIMGNMANPDSFGFEVRYETADIEPGWWLDEQGPSTAHLEAFLTAAQRLQDAGVAAVTTTCGLFAVFQTEAAARLRVPVFTTPLMMIPMISRMVGPTGRVGVVTAAGDKITGHGFLEQSGVSADTKIAVAAVDASPEFLDVIRTQSRPHLDSAALEDQLLGEVQTMLSEYPDVAALLLECSDIPPYSRRLAAETGLPTFDFVSFTTMVRTACQPPAFAGRPTSTSRRTDKEH